MIKGDELMGEVVNFVVPNENISAKRRKVNTYDISKEKKESGKDMENDKILELYISKVDKDQAELKQDVRDSEKRFSDKVLESEIRMDNRLERIEGMINEQSKDVISLKDEIKNRMEEDKKYRHTNNIAIVIGVITTVIAMIGIYYATVSMVTDILNVAK